MNAGITDIQFAIRRMTTTAATNAEPENVGARCARHKVPSDLMLCKRRWRHAPFLDCNGVANYDALWPGTFYSGPIRVVIHKEYLAVGMACPSFFELRAPWS